VPVRAIAIGLALIPVNAFWLVRMEMATSQNLKTGGSAGPYPTTFSLFANVICFLVAIAAANAWVRRRRPAAALSQTEMLVVYVMLTISTCFTSVDFLPVLFGMLGHATKYATDFNGWQDLFVKHIPTWMHVTDKAAVEAYYAGVSNPYEWRLMRAWLVPVGAWAGFTLVLVLVMLGMNILVRRQWTQSEKLSYPIIQLPLDMTDTSGGFYRQRLLWAGFGVAAGISLVNGLNVFFPSMPAVPVKLTDLSPYLVSKPWNAMGWTPISFYPFAIGLGFLLPVDLLFSCWFFYFYWKLQRVVSSAYGWSDYNASFPYVNEQSFGAYIAVAALAVWGVRKHIAQSLKRPRDAQPPADDPIPYRWAAVGVVVGLALLMAFFRAAGLPLWMCVAAFAIYYAICIACTRMRAELGPPAHDLHNGGPDYMLAAVWGTRGVAPQTLSVLTFFYWFNRAYRSLPMPCQLEAFKIAERKRISAGGMALAIVVATLAGLFCACWALYDIGYRHGAEVRMAGHFSYFGWEAFNRLQSWTQSPREMDVPALLAAGLGLATTLLLQVIRMRFTGWPFHPLGLAVSGSWTMNTIWLPMFIAWAVKASLLRYGGLRSYRTALYFFMGLILGDYLPGCLWPIVGWIVGANAYSFQQ